MAIFRYKAVTASGDPIEGEMEARTRDEVILKLQDAGNIPLDAREATSGGGAGLGGLFKRKAMAGPQLVAFTAQLATLMGAGQPLDRALQILIDLPEDEGARKMIERIRESVRGGASLSAALEQQHGVFSRLYVNMVRAGEVSGSLHGTLKRLAEYMERSRAVRDSVVSAMIYPVILMVMVVGALVLLLAAVNVASLLLTRIGGRSREIATLRALGFGGGPVVASVLIESLLLALAGGVAGAAAAWWAFDGFQASTLNWQSLSQVAFAFTVTPALVGRALLFALLLGLVGGLPPALRAARLPVVTALREL